MPDDRIKADKFSVIADLLNTKMQLRAGRGIILTPYYQITDTARGIEMTIAPPITIETAFCIARLLEGDNPCQTKKT